MSLQHSFIIQQNFIFHVHVAHIPVFTTVVYCLQSKLPAHQFASITVHSTQNEKTATIQLCQYQYPSSNNDCLKHNELEWTWKWSQPVWSTIATYAWTDREKPMKICQASWCHGQDSHQVLTSEPIPSVDLYNIIHHHYHKCLNHIPVYLITSIP